MAITGVPPQDVADYPWSNTGGPSGPGSPPPQPPPGDWGWYWWIRVAPTTCTSTDGELYFEVSCERLFYAIGIVPIGHQFPTTSTASGSMGANPPLAPACPNCLFPIGFDFSLQDASGNYMPADSAGAGYMGSSTASITSSGVPITSFSQAVTAPYHYTQTACHPSNMVWNPSTNTYTCSTPSNIPVPIPSGIHWFQAFKNLPTGDYTYTIDNITCNGIAVQSPSPNSLTLPTLHPNSILHFDPNWSGPPAPNPCHDPKWYCDDFNCQEIMYPTVPPSVPPVSYWTMGTGQVFSGSLLSTIINTGTIPNNPYPYTALGGVWYGFTTLLQMANTPGSVAIVPPGKPPSTSIWTPLHYNVDDCIDCCGGINIPAYSNGTPNPYYGTYSTHPTIIPANQNANFAAYLTLNPNAHMVTYLPTVGITAFCTS